MAGIDPTETFKSLAGVPIHYARPPQALYGSLGVPVRRVGPVTAPFLKSLEAAAQALVHACPHPIRAWIVASVFRKGENSRHGTGTALDLDGVWLEGAPPVISLKCPKDPMRYMAVEACLRTEFGQVLGWHYNAQHHDHWHIDDRRPPGFYQNSKQCVLFVQAALQHVFKRDVEIDGAWGPITEAAATDILSQIDNAPETLAVGWRVFLDATAAVGFNVLEKHTP